MAEDDRAEGARDESEAPGTREAGAWVHALPETAVRGPVGRTVRVGGHTVAIFRDGGELLATDDACPHQGASLGEGFVHDGMVVCPWHSWMFDIRTGVCRRAPRVTVATYRVRVRDGEIEVWIPDARSDRP